MEILHRRRRATVEEIRGELPDAPSPSSVRKLLEIMIERGLLAREIRRPALRLLSRRETEDASRSALQQLVRTFFNDSPGSAMAALLDISSTPLSDAEYRRSEQAAETGARTGRRAMSTSVANRRIRGARDRRQGLGPDGDRGRCPGRRGPSSVAATRHLLWTLAIVSVLLLPVASLVLPGWAVEVRSGPEPANRAPVAAREAPAWI